MDKTAYLDVVSQIGYLLNNSLQHSTLIIECRPDIKTRTSKNSLAIVGCIRSQTPFHQTLWTNYLNNPSRFTRTRRSSSSAVGKVIGNLWRGNIITIGDGYLECDVVVLPKLLELVVCVVQILLTLVESAYLVIIEPSAALVEVVVRLVVEVY